MRNTTAIFLLILLSFPAFSQQSSEPSSGSTTCFTDAELEAMEDEATRIMQDAVADAVNAAVAPYRITVQDMNAELDAKDRSIVFWKITTGISAGMMVFFAVMWAISSCLPAVP